MRNRPLCFFDLEVDGIHEGRLIFQLYNDLAPRTSEKFRKLCNGEEGLSYKGTTFHKIVFNYMAQGGDITSTTNPENNLLYDESIPR